MATPGPGSAWRYLYLRAVAGTLTDLLGVEAADRAARMLARGVFDLNPPIRASVEHHLGVALAAAGASADVAGPARENFQHVARFWVELFYLRRRLSAANWRRFVDTPEPDRWRDLTANPGPLILVTPRAGQPAVAACVLSDMLGGLTVPVDPLVYHFAATQPAVRQRFGGLTLIPAYAAGPRITTLLERGGRLLVPSGDDVGSAGARLPFLGHTRPQRLTVARLAIRHRARVAVLCCFRADTPFRFSLVLGDVLPPPPPGTAAVAWTARILRSLESLILGHPAQYLWTRRS